MSEVSRFRSNKDVSTAVPPAQLVKILYDRKSAAFTLSISVRSLDYLISNKRIRTTRVGRKVMVRHGELIKFSQQNHDCLTEQNSQISRE